MSGLDGHTGQQAPQCLRSRGQGEKTEEIVVYFLESMSDQEESVCVCACTCACIHACISV